MQRIGKLSILFPAVTALFLAGTAAPAVAATIPIANTGLGTPTAADPNWTVNAVTAFVTDQTGYPFPLWVAPGGPSEWISPQASYTGVQTDVPGSYNYVTSFDLTGLIPGTASITFIVAVDNLLTDVLLNGGTTGITYNSLSAFSGALTINTGFSAGVNTLEFQTTNTPFAGGNPSGLRVEFASATADEVIPEPASVFLLGTGIALLYARRFRRNRLRKLADRPSR